MDLGAFHFLLSEAGERRLAALTAEPITAANHLQLAMGLREAFSPEASHALLETALLRQKGRDKFSRAEEMYFTREALEQASSEAVSHYRAARYAAAGMRTVADLGCSIGGDALALAAHCMVIGIDRDPLRLAMARENVAAYGRSNHFQPLLADLEALPPLDVDAFFFDPARRDEQGRRLFSVHDYHPPLSLTERWLPSVPHGAVKISPGVDYAELPSEAEVEFISLDGEVKEGVLWYGELGSGVQRRATLLPGAHTLSDADNSGEPSPVTGVRRFLYEPDGAVIRAHLVQTLAQRLDATRIDEAIAYLTADQAQETPFARCFVVEEVLPFHLKRLRRRLQERGIGRVTIKKRGSPLEPDELRRRLRLSGPEVAILFLTHVQGEPSVLIGQEYTPPTPQLKS